MQPMRFSINSLWDGTAARTDERVELTLVPGDLHWRIEVEAPFHGDTGPLEPIGTCWQLWDYEVAEVFILGQDSQYTEIELGPHGHHLVLRLDGSRRVIEKNLPIQYTATVDNGRWRGVAELPVDYLPRGPYRVNAYAIHGAGDARRYLAWMPVPGAAPDFHRLEFFRPFADVKAASRDSA